MLKGRHAADRPGIELPTITETLGLKCPGPSTINAQAPDKDRLPMG